MKCICKIDVCICQIHEIKHWNKYWKWKEILEKSGKFVSLKIWERWCLLDSWKSQGNLSIRKYGNDGLLDSYVIYSSLLDKSKIQSKGSNLDWFRNQYLLEKSVLSPTLENHKHPIKSHCKTFDNLILSCHTFPRSFQVGFSLLVDPTSTLLGNVSCVYDFPLLEIGDIFGINTDLRIDPNSSPYTELMFSDFVRIT